jgi:16S rRNA (guanine966-N2)-methyltransferase
MRIISGIFKGRRIDAPSNLPVRPTTDIAKEGLFNWLNNRIDFEGIDVMDLFFGTGNISLEFLSRGALHITAVDKNPECVRFLADITRKMDLFNIKIFNADVFIALERVKEKFDVIFADPPYDFPKYQQLLSEILNKDILKVDGLLIIEHPKEVSFEHPFLLNTRKYGKVHFSIFQNSNEI